MAVTVTSSLSRGSSVKSAVFGASANWTTSVSRRKPVIVTATVKVPFSSVSE